MRFKNFNVRVPWGKLAVRNWGKDYREPSCEKLLFVNGMHSWLGQWDALADRLENENVSMIGFDDPGSGGSSYPDHYFPMANLTGFAMRCLIKELEWENVHICGHSHGAYIASIYAMLYPDETASLTNIDGYFNMRLRAQKSVLTRYIRHEMDTIVNLSKETPVVKPKTHEELTSAFKTHHQLYKYSNVNATKIAESFVTDSFQQNADGNYIPKSHPMYGKLYGPACWSYNDADFLEFLKLIDFPILHVKSAVHDSPSGIFFPNKPVSFPHDLTYSHGTAELVEEAARENNCKFTEHYVNGPHLLHVTHPEEISPVLLANMQSGNS